MCVAVVAAVAGRLNWLIRCFDHMGGRPPRLLLLCPIRERIDFLSFSLSDWWYLVRFHGFEGLF